MSEPVIQFRRVSFSYGGESFALRNINLEINQGEFVAIVGPNGAGKTTLAKHIIGLHTAQEGQLLIDGKDSRSLSSSELTSEVGYLFQNPDHQLFMSRIWDELAFSLRQRKLSDDEISRQVEEALDLVDLKGFDDRHPFMLSRGQRKCLAVATVLMHRPRIVVLDEPTTGQDHAHLDGVLLLILRAQERKSGAIVMITHDMDLVVQYASRLVGLFEGSVIVDDTPENVFLESPDLAAQLGLGQPSAVRISQKLEEYGVSMTDLVVITHGSVPPR